MSLECYIGPERNLLETTEEHAHRLRIPHPILSNEQLAALKHMDHRGWRTKTIDITWPRSEGHAGMIKALDRICAEAEAAIDDGYSLVVLSDRAIGRDRVPLSSLLATGAVHHHLVRKAKRTRIGIVVESGEAREVHHHCLLVGYGADAINPYLAFESLWQSRREGLLQRPEGLDSSDQSGEGKEHPAIEAGANGEVVRPGHQRRPRSRVRVSQGRRQGHAQGDGQDGHLDAAKLQGRADLRSRRPQGRSHRPLLRRHGQPHSGRRFRRAGRGSAAAARARLSRRRRVDRTARAAQPGRVPLAGRRRTAHVGPAGDRRPASRRPQQQRATPTRRFADHANRDAQTRCALRGLLAVQAGRERRTDSARRSDAGQGNRQAVLHRRDELRLDLGRGTRDAGHRHEPPRRQEQHGRRRRRPRAIQAAAQRRLEAIGDQASRLRPIRRHDLVPRQRRRAADQDFARRQAGRRRRAARPQGRRQHRPHPLFDARRGPHQPAAAPRHLFDRGPQAAHPRPEEQQPVGAGEREAGLRSGRRHDRGRRGQGLCRSHSHFRRHRRHRRFAAHEHQARRPAVGTGHRRNAPDARAERPAQPRHAADRRRPQDGPRRGDRRHARRRRIRLRHRPARSRSAAS